MFAFLSELVALGWFTEIHMNFLPPGHTHSNLDQKYSVISQKLRATDLFLLSHVMEEVEELFAECGPMTSQVLVPATADFVSYYKGRTHHLTGHGTVKVNGENRRLHSFRVMKGPDGKVGITFKEHDEVGPWSYRWDKPDHHVLVLKDSGNASESPLQTGLRKRVSQNVCQEFPTIDAISFGFH